MSTNRTNSFSEHLNSLIKEYIESLPEKIKSIEMWLKEQNQEEVYRQIHRLKGSGTTYGCPEVSKLCDVMELLYDEDPSQFIQTIPTCLEILREICKYKKEGRTRGNGLYKLEDDPRFSNICQYLSTE